MDFDYLAKYENKIKNSRELKEILGDFPRLKKVIMCHGVFDVVHPGHIRHLSYAKSKADILVVSVTSDRHIKKGTYRPAVPEKLRALNLAAFEMVDFVIIDENTTPILNLELLKPDFFAKGFEYSATEMPKATTEEIETLEGYGGKTIFTPGDFVLSSSNLIESHTPKLMLDKMISLMRLDNITFEQIESTLGQFDNLTVHVIGDTIIDNHISTVMHGGQIKTPTISVRQVAENSYVGGAGIVALHLSAAGANVTFTTLIGDDNNSQLVRNEMRKFGVDLIEISEVGRPTTQKNVIICNGYRLLKLDKLDNTPISDSITKEFLNSIEKTQCEIIVFSDFRHGIFHKQNIQILTDAIPKGIFSVADSQVASRWGNISDFKKFDLITPNEREARFSVADQDSTIGPLASKLFDVAECNNLLLKLGDKGLIGMTNGVSEYQPRIISLDALTEFSIDPVGAGDSLLAYATLALHVSGSLSMAAIIGSIAAACETEIDGNIPIQRADVIRKLNSLRVKMEYAIE